MRDPDLIVRAQLAASALEGAWHRWRVVHGDVVDPMPTVSSYVGYSLQEPWGQPRVVFGLAAEDAEQLAALLERHDRVGVRTFPRDVTVPVPRRAPLAAANKPGGQSPAEVLLAGDSAGYDEPLYRQVAAAMKETAVARQIAIRTKTAAIEPAHARPPHDDADPADPQLLSPAWMGSLAMAASTARAEAEARIKAALTKPANAPAPSDAVRSDAVRSDAVRSDAVRSDAVRSDAVRSDAAPSDAVPSDAAPSDPVDPPAFDAGEPPPSDAGDAPAFDADAREADADLDDGDSTALPQIYATHVLEPLPTSDAVPGAGIPAVEEPTEELVPPDQDDKALRGNASDEDDQDVAPSVQSDDSRSATARRGRANRGYPIARLSRTKRPGASSQPAAG